MTTAEWVRQALRDALGVQAGTSVADKLAAVRRASAHGFPTADIDAMLAHIERGYSESDS
jgi:predicted metal-dependent HD superfamily phosphohydrolase